MTSVTIMKQTIHAVLIFSFLAAAGFLFYAFAADVANIIVHKNANSATSLLQAFGTLLVLWTVTELVQAEVEVMRGHRFGAEILVDVAMAALIRKILIADFKIDPAFFGEVGGILVFAIVRFLLTAKTNQQKSS